MQYTFVVTVETDTLAHAEQVMAERTAFDEMYEDDVGAEFDYQFVGEPQFIRPP